MGGRWSVRTISLVALVVFFGVRTLMDLRVLPDRKGDVVSIPSSVSARDDATPKAESVISSPKKEEPEIAKPVVTEHVVVNVKSVRAPKHPKARVVRLLFCKGIIWEKFALSLCQTLDRVAGPNLTFQCVHETSPAPDFFFNDNGPRSCDVSIAAERQLHLRYQTGGECNHEATVLWTGVNPPGLCPNVFHVPSTLVDRMAREYDFSKVVELTRPRSASNLRSRDIFCSIYSSRSCSSSVMELANFLECEGRCGSPVIPTTNHKFALVIEPSDALVPAAELLSEAYWSGAVPVYVGASLNDNGWVNTRALVHCSPVNRSECAATLKKLSLDHDVYTRMTSQPLFLRVPDFLAPDGLARTLLLQWRLARLDNTTGELEIDLPFSSVADEIVDYETCVRKAVPASFWEGPSEAIRSDLNQLSKFVFARHKEVLQLMQQHGCELRLMLFECTGGCGGHGDRIKGMITAFTFALLSNSQFATRWTKPVDIQWYYDFPKQFLEVAGAETFPSDNVWAQYKSRVPASRMRVMDVAGGPSILTGNATEHLYDEGTATPHCNVCFNLSNYVSKDLMVIVKHNLASWSFLQTNPCFAHTARMYGLDKLSWMEMMRVLGRPWFAKPRPALAHAVAKLAGEAGEHPLVAVHLRMGGGKWSDPGRHPVSHVPCFAEAALKVCKKVSPTGVCSYLVASDYKPSIEPFESSLKKLDGDAKVVVFERNADIVRHHDKSAGDGRTEKEKVAAWLSSFVEWQTLHSAKGLVVSRSGFSETVAWMTGVPTIRFKDKVADCTSHEYKFDGSDKMAWYN